MRSIVVVCDVFPVSFVVVLITQVEVCEVVCAHVKFESGKSAVIKEISSDFVCLSYSLKPPFIRECKVFLNQTEAKKTTAMSHEP